MCHGVGSVGVYGWEGHIVLCRVVVDDSECTCAGIYCEHQCNNASQKQGVIWGLCQPQQVGNTAVPGTQRRRSFSRPQIGWSKTVPRWSDAMKEKGMDAGLFGSILLRLPKRNAVTSNACGLRITYGDFYLKSLLPPTPLPTLQAPAPCCPIQPRLVLPKPTPPPSPSPLYLRKASRR